jgi:hypothetical protein
MADLTAAAPIETEKTGDYLHDMTNRPQPPESRTPDLIKRYTPGALALLLTFAVVALAFETRDSWTSHRDWVIPVNVPFFAIAGLALAHLLIRHEWLAALPGFTLLLVSSVFMAINVWIGAAGAENQDGARLFLAIAGGIGIVFGVIALLIGLVWVEAKRPTRAPAATL